MKATADMLKAVEAASPGATLLDVEPLVGGSSAMVVRLLLELATGERRHVVFRQHADRVAKGHDSRVAEKEHALLAILADAGLEVPAPIAICGDEPTDGSWLAMEFVDGSSAVTTDHLDGALSAMADFLIRLHRSDTGTARTAGLQAIEDPLLALPAYLPDDATGRAIRQHIESGVPRRLETNAQMPNDSVVLHGDYWPGNVLFADTDAGRQLVAVIDWEDAALGDPLVDLACARVELTCSYGAEAARVFTDRYLAGFASLNLTDLPLWEMYVSATALSSMHLWGLAADEEEARRATTRSFLDAAAEKFLNAAS